MTYESMKPSGTAWLGNIPATWDCKKIGSLFTQRKVKVSDKDYPALSVSKIGVTPQLETAVKTDNGDNRKLVKTGDFVINSRSDRKGSCGVSALDGSVSLINIVLTPRQEWNERYVHYLLRSHLFSEEYYHYGRGIVADLWTTRYSEMKNILLPIPPRDEQDQIARYLDWQLSKINRLISAVKKEIALIKEIEANQITSTVWGQTSNNKTKQSGILGIGEVPEHWSIRTNKRIFKERNEKSEAGTEPLLSVSRHYGVKPSNELSEDEQYATIKPAESLVGYKIVKKNDLAMNIMRAQNGSYGISDYEGIVSPAYCVYELLPGYSPKYMHYLLKTPQMISIFFAASSGITDHRRRLYADDFLRIKIAVPPFEEQEQIVEQIERIEATFQGKTAAIEKQIELLKELRTRLISDVVTGQIDVRGVEIPEYEFVEDVSEDSEDSESEEEIVEQEKM